MREGKQTNKDSYTAKGFQEVITRNKDVTSNMIQSELKRIRIDSQMEIPE